MERRLDFFCRSRQRVGRLRALGANFVNWVPVSTNLLLAPNATITAPGAVGGKNLFYRTRTSP